MMNDDMRNSMNDMTKRPLTFMEVSNLADNMNRVENQKEAMNNISFGKFLLAIPICFVIMYIIGKILESGIIRI